MSLKRIVEETDTFAGRLFDGVVIGLILLTIVAFSLETIPDLSHEVLETLQWVELVSVLVFTLEYVLRLVVADRKLGFAFSFFGLVDLLAILPFYISLGVDLRSVRAIRLLRLVRVLKLARYSDAMSRFGRTATMVRGELFVFLGAAVVLIYLSAVGIYYFENDAQPEKFTSITDSLWWAIVTLTTVGYGDAYPITTGGRLFTFLVLMAGLGIVAVPTGLIASALVKVREQDLAAAQEMVGPRVKGVIETSLHVTDLEESVTFYRDVFGFTVARGPTDRMVALNIGQDQVLLLFKRGASQEPTVLPFGTIPAHDGGGRLHVTFGIKPTELDDWERRLRDARVGVESVVVWPEGGRSLYFRDPDGHAVELKTSTWAGRVFH